ncbi:MAG TPA: hypothetical protein VES42_14555 [Pilimelia sp.]|nr:hypothetical protein [Pilimelia sp.]
MGVEDGGYGNDPVSNNEPAAAAPAAPAAAAAAPTPDPSTDAQGDQATKEIAPEDLTQELVAKSVARMGRVVTDQDGWTLYRFDNDTADPPQSNCNDKCEKVWPPAYTDGNPVVEGVDESLVGTVTRADGTRQLTIDGWAVYRYAGDKKPGQWKGQGVGGTWYVVDPDGKKNKSCLPETPPKAYEPPDDGGQDDGGKDDGGNDDGGKDDGGKDGGDDYSGGGGGDSGGDGYTY